jgi:hypothetical protein
MGKRELVIAIAFLAAGFAAYWATARPGDRPAIKDTLPDMVDEWRRNAAQSAARETVQTIGTRGLDRQVSEIRLGGFTRVHVIGEDRPDLAWTLVTEAGGPTPAAAKETAAETVVAVDALGDALILTPKSPPNTRQTTEVTVRLPEGMAVRLENSRRVTAERTGRTRLESLVGDVTLTEISGAITGVHRNGALTVTGAANVTLNLNGSQAVLSGIAGDLTVTARNGDVRIVSPGGTTSVDTNNVTLTITEPRGAVRTNVGSGGLVVNHPRADLHADVRNARADVSLDRATPVTLVGNNSVLAVSLTGAPPVGIDASITEGQIDASALGLSPEHVGDGARLMQTDGSHARLTIRATRGAIVIARGK